ncbi:MAG: hypothetical protein ACK4K0_12335 [Flavobacteriales bacterium]
MLKTLALLVFSLATVNPYTNAEGKFTINFPTKDVSHTSEKASGIDVHMFLCVHEGVVYLVGYSDFGIKAMNADDKSVAAKAAAEGFMESVSIKGSVKPVKQSGQKGFEAKGSNQDGTLTTTYRAFMKEDRLYQVGVLGAKGDMPNTKQIKAFFASFKVF